MSDYPRVSVIIPAYNRAQYIREAINSVLEQSYQAQEIIIVDDGSTDNTRQVLEDYASKIRYFHQSNRGPAAARNLGVQRSLSGYIAFLDSDDIWLPEKLKKQMQILESSPELAFVCSQAYVIDGNGNPLFCFNKSKHSKENFVSLREENFISTQTVLLRRDCFEAVGGFDEALSNAQDYDLWLRLSMRYKFRFMDEALCLVRKHQTNNTRNTDGRVSSYQRILNKTEIWSDMPSLKRHMRFARIYHEFASCYAASKHYHKAARFYLKSTAEYPLVGRFFSERGPEEVKTVSNRAYKLFRPYWLAAKFFLKGI